MFVEGAVVGEKTTKGGFNKYMGYTAKDLPAGEDKKVEGYIYEVAGESNHEDHEGFLIWLPANAVKGMPAEVLTVAQNPSVFGQLSPVKQKNVVKFVKEYV